MSATGTVIIGTSPHQSRGQDSRAQDEWAHGHIKWFDQVRRFGFVIDEDGRDVFLPWTALQNCEIPERQARIGAAVRFKSEPPERPGKNPRVTHIEIVR